MFTKSDRAYLSEMGALAIDPNGNEHLVGLTLDETAFYIRVSQAPLEGDFPSKPDIEHYLALQHRHETSRLEGLNAKLHLHDDRSSIQ